MSAGVSGAAAIRPGDADFRVWVGSLEQLLAMQRESEDMGWGTRWSSTQAMLKEVGDKRIYIFPLIRERRDDEGVTTKYRCVLLYRRAGQRGGGGLVTFDIASKTLMALPSLDLSPEAELAFADVFHRALDGIQMTVKERRTSAFGASDDDPERDAHRVPNRPSNRRRDLRAG
jgi:hypothetical protein